MILLIYQMVLILLDIFKIILNLSLKNRPAQIYPNKTKNRIVLNIKTGYKLELLTADPIKLLGSAKKDVDKDKGGEIVPKLESVEVILVHCNLLRNYYQHPNKQFSQLINISRHSLTMMKTVNTEFSYVEVWFTDQASKELDVNLTLIIE